MDSKACEYVPRARNKNFQWYSRDSRVYRGIRNILGGPKVYRKAFDNKEEKVRHPSMGSLDRFQASESLEVWIMLHSILFLDLSSVRPKQQEDSPDEQLCHKGNKQLKGWDLVEHDELKAVLSRSISYLREISLQ